MSALEINIGHLIAAIKAGRRFDGPKFVNHHGTYKPETKSKTGSLPPWLMPFQPPYQHSGLERVDHTTNKDYIPPVTFKKSADEARNHASGEVGSDKNWPYVKRTVLMTALAEAALELSQEPTDNQISLERLRMRNGLQLYGVEITSDEASDNDVTPLNLVNGDFPFSLRLICCVVRIPLAMSNLKLVTLDLSGSALVGVDAAFIRTQGSVRLRHSYSTAPLDFSGAQIHGYFDSRDALLQPFGDLPAAQAVDDDRGMLSLGQASVENEVQLSRAIIWGGLVLRGLKAKRSVVMDEAVILSPLAVLEQILFYRKEKEKELLLTRYRPSQQKIPKPYRLIEYQEKRDIAFDISKGSAFKNFANGDMDSWKKSCLNVLISENLRVRTSAIRADGLVAESVFARDLMCAGRLRMKYAVVHDGLSLQGASLSSPEFQRANFDHFEDIKNKSKEINEILQYRTITYNALVRKEQRDDDALAYGADDYALDLREAHFGGSVRIGTPPDEQLANNQDTHIDGVIALVRTKIGGGLLFNGVKFSWTFRLKLPFDPEKGSYDISRDLAEKDRDKRVVKGGRYAIEARGIVTGASVTFFKSKNLNGADFTNAEIGGNFEIFKTMERPKNNIEDYLLSVTDAAIGVRGRITLEGARVKGDCKLVFDPAENFGPNIKAERIDVAGALVISAVPNSNGKISMKPSDYSEILKNAEDKINEFKVAANNRASFRLFEETRRSVPMIDLGNARAGFFHHPPPAWPQAGRLLVTGFRYQRALNYGPLAPHLYASGEVVFDQIKENRIKAFNKFMIIINITTLYFLLFKQDLVKNYTGIFETQALFGFMIFAMIYRFISKQTAPRLSHNQPMAVAWLNLQTVARNAYKLDWSLGAYFKSLMNKLSFGKIGFVIKGNTYHSLEPYAIAAQALREEGRWVSANLVEERRLKMREHQLSWRISMVQKTLFRATSIISNYGFSLTRPLFMIGLLILFGAMAAYNANKYGAIDQKVYSVDAGLTKTVEKRDGIVCKIVSKADHSCKEFTPFIFAIDKVVPAIDLNQDSDWELKKNTSPFRGAFSFITYERLFAFLNISGLTIVGLLLISLSTRLGFVFNRYSE